MTVQKDNLIFPPVPQRFDLYSWINWASAVTSFLKRYVLNFNSPAIVTGVTAESISLGIGVTWNAANNCDSYRIYRSYTPASSDSLIIAEVFGHETLYFIDDGAQFIGSTMYYWVQGLNKIRQTAALSNRASIGTDGFGGISGVTGAGVLSVNGALVVGSTVAYGALPALGYPDIELHSIDPEVILNANAVVTTTGLGDIFVLFQYLGVTKAEIYRSKTDTLPFLNSKADDFTFAPLVGRYVIAAGNMNGNIPGLAVMVLSNGSMVVNDTSSNMPTGGGKGAGTINVPTGYYVNGANAAGTFTTSDGKTITVVGGIVTSIV